MANHNQQPPARPTQVIDFGEERPPPQLFDMMERSQPWPETIAVRLYLEQGPDAPRTIEVTDPITVLGRGEGVIDVSVSDESASRYHACISRHDGQFFINDMGSANGTFINGQLVAEATLKNGDQVQIGTSVFRFEVNERQS